MTITRATIPQPPDGILAKIDFYVLDIKTSFTDLFSNYSSGNREGLGDAVLRHLNGHAWFYYLCLSSLRTASQAVVAYTSQTPRFFTLLENQSFILGTTICGFVTNAITAVQETIGILRQSKILSIFRQNKYQENILNIADDIKALTQKYTPAELMARLRPWFVGKEQLTTHNRLNRLAEAIRSSDPTLQSEAVQEATTLLNNMRCLAIKKLALHIIGLVAVTLSIAGMIGSLIGCPPLAVILLLGAGYLLWQTRSIVSIAYVDNPDPTGGFSPILLVPQRIVNWFKPAAVA